MHSINDGSLTTSRPAVDGTDTSAWSPAGNPCGRSVDQWSIGLLSQYGGTYGLTDEPCTTDDSTVATGRFLATYTTSPFTAARTLAGPISAQLYAAATTTDTQLTVTIEDVAPDGNARPLTEGAIQGSLRAVDPARSWPQPDGSLLRPYQPLTAASAKPVTPGQVTRYDVEIFPTYSTIAAGHRLRASISTVDTPHLVENSRQLPNVIGGVYTLQRTAKAPSSIELPLSTSPTPVAAAGTTRHRKPATATGGATSPAGHRSALAATGPRQTLPLLALGALTAALLLHRRRTVH